MAKKNDMIVVHILQANYTASNVTPQKIKCKIYKYFHKKRYFVETGEIPFHWNENAKKRMQERIKRFNNSGRKFFIIVVESDQSTNGKKRKKREKNPVIDSRDLNGDYQWR